MPDPFPKTPSKYRRAFDWRLIHGTSESRQIASAAMTRLASSDFPEILEDFLEISRKRRKNWTAMARLQAHMIEELLIQEKAVEHYRTKIEQLQGIGAEGTAAGSQTSPEMDFLKRELFFYRMYANAVRCIGDGIAWRTLGYDRAVTRLMSERETKQWLTSEGLVQELREWSWHFERGTGMAILNALTNCLAIGDVTVVRPDDSVEIIEVKSSNTKSGRKVRQRQRMSEVVTLLATGSGRTEEKEVQIEILPVTPQTGLDQINGLLRAAAQDGAAAKKISNCLYAEAVDFRKADNIERSQKRSECLFDSVVGEWGRRGDLVIDFDSLDALAFTPNCAPFSIYPFDARTCVDLLIGAKHFVTYLNHDAVAREFETRGWTVEQTSQQLFEQGDKEAMMVVTKGECHIRIPHADFMRLQMEALRAKSLIDALEARLRQGYRGSEGFLLGLFSGEADLWN